MKKIILFFAIFVSALFGFAGGALAHAPRIIYYTEGDVVIKNPENSQAFYDELKGASRNYIIESASDFNLYLNLLVPEVANYKGRYSANVFLVENQEEKLTDVLDAGSSSWPEFYESFGRDYYLKGPELDKKMPAGKYRIEVFSNLPAEAEGNQGKYVLAVGKTEYFSLSDIFNVYWQLPLLKIKFFQTPVIQFFFTIFFIVAFIMLVVLGFLLWIIASLIAFTYRKIVSNEMKTIILTSAGMRVKDQIFKILAMPPDKVVVAHIITASKSEEDTSYVAIDKEAMQKAGFNVHDIDITGKSKNEILELLKNVNVIYMQGGNTFFLMNQIRKTGFDKILEKLIRKGVLYIGVSAGSIVAGKSIESAGWLGDENKVKLKNLKGMNLVDFNIFVHYKPEYEEIIRQELPDLKQRKKLRILTDDQALVVQGKEVLFVGQGEEIKI
jgi:dipeptidase E